MGDSGSWRVTPGVFSTNNTRVHTWSLDDLSIIGNISENEISMMMILNAHKILTVIFGSSFHGMTAV